MTVAQIEKRLTGLLELPGNDSCSECDRPDNKPTWASFFVCPVDGKRLGVLCCPKCHHLHQTVGEGEFCLKGLKDVNEFNENDLEALEISGNKLVNTAYEMLVRDEKDGRESRKFGYEAYFFEKFINRRYFDEGMYKDLISKSVKAHSQKQQRLSDKDDLKSSSHHRTQKSDPIDNDRKVVRRSRSRRESNDRDDYDKYSKDREVRKSGSGRGLKDSKHSSSSSKIDDDARTSHHRSCSRDDRKRSSSRDDDYRSSHQRSRSRDDDHHRSRSRDDDYRSSHNRSSSRDDRDRSGHHRSSSRDDRHRSSHRRSSGDHYRSSSSHHRSSRSRDDSLERGSYHRSSTNSSRDDCHRSSSRSSLERGSSHHRSGSSHHRSKSPRRQSNDREERYKDEERLIKRDSKKSSKHDLLEDSSEEGRRYRHGNKKGSKQDLLDESDYEDSPLKRTSSSVDSREKRREKRKDGLKRDLSPRRTTSFSKNRIASTGDVVTGTSSLGLQKSSLKKNSSGVERSYSSSGLRNLSSGGNAGQANARWDGPERRAVKRTVSSPNKNGLAARSLEDVARGVNRTSSGPQKRALGGRSHEEGGMYSSNNRNAPNGGTDPSSRPVRGMTRALSERRIRNPQDGRRALTSNNLLDQELQIGRQSDRGGTSMEEMAMNAAFGNALESASRPPPRRGLDSSGSAGHVESGSPSASQPTKKLSAREFFRSRRADLLKIAEQERLEREAAGNPIEEEAKSPLEFLRSQRKQIIQMAKKERAGRGRPAPAQRGVVQRGSANNLQALSPSKDAPETVPGKKISAREFFRSRRADLLRIAEQERLEREAAGNPIEEEAKSPLEFLRSQRKQIIQMAKKERAGRGSASQRSQRAQRGVASNAQQGYGQPSNAHLNNAQPTNHQMGYAQPAAREQLVYSQQSNDQVGYAQDFPGVRGGLEPRTVVQDFPSVPPQPQVGYSEHAPNMPTSEHCEDGESKPEERRGAKYWKQRLQEPDKQGGILSSKKRQERRTASLTASGPVPTACA